MPESRNTFIKSKMNKDLDARLIPKGEYRDAFNVSVSKSEGDDVGSLENILGNIYITNFGFSTTNDQPISMECIGHFPDEGNNRIILFLTAYEDCSFDNLSNNINDSILGTNAEYSAIVCFNINDGSFNILTQGNYLNFSTTHPIIGVNLIEELLFFTDNRNQPRKINVNTAIGDPNYYNNEDHISVAKYYPYNPISLLENVSNRQFLQGTNQPAYNSGMKDVVSEYLPIHTSSLVTSVSSSQVEVGGEHYNIQPEQVSSLGDGDLVSSNRLNATTKIKVDTVTVNQTSNSTAFTLINPSGIALTKLFEVGDIIYFQRQNPLYEVNWPGDPEYTRRKFLRFSYRFKFDDGEYSLMAPFTQIAFVPKQDGYFIGDKATNTTTVTSGLVEDGSVQAGQESKAYESTIVDFMENKINDYNLIIEAPSKFEGLENLMNFNEINSLLKITEIDILFKLSDSQNVTVIDTLKIVDFGNLASTFYNYNYQSKKPWRILPEKEITRVSDAVPIRAFSQEVVGNRVVYGNFYDKHSSPINLDYTVAVSDKFPLPEWDGQQGTEPSTWLEKEYYLRKEYQNHTLKQNRTYQVGVVLSDRYGRQSNVILSKLKSSTNANEKGDTIYHRYKSVEQNLITDNTSTYSSNPRDTWPGDALQATFFSPIPSQTNEGYPGVFSVANGAIVEITSIVNNVTFPTAKNFTNVPITPNSGSGSGATVSFTTIADPLGSGKILIDLSTLVLVTRGLGYIQGEGGTISAIPYGGIDVNINILTDKTNTLGWYSYKFVVKQQEQEYYNVYLPGALAGYPKNQAGVEPSPTLVATPEFNYPVGNEKSTSHIVLINDNINKIPRDLTEVGPDQLKFRSSERVYQRVRNIITTVSSGKNNYSSTQVDPETSFDTVTAIGTMQDLDLGDVIINSVDKTIPSIFYSGENNPLIARVQTNSIFGVTQANLDNSFSVRASQGPTLAVYETSPVESNLELFYETTTSGVISELNFNIENTDNTIPVGVSINEISFSEADPGNTVITNDFRGIGPGGAFLDGTATVELIKVTNGINQDITSRFTFSQVSSGVYNIKIAQYNSNHKGFIYFSNQALNNFVFQFLVIRTIDGVSVSTSVNGQLFNRAPNEILITNPPELTKSEIKAASAIEADSTSNGSAVLSSKYGFPFTLKTSPTSWSTSGNINFGPIGIFKSTAEVNGNLQGRSTRVLPSYNGLSFSEDPDPFFKNILVPKDYGVNPGNPPNTGAQLPPKTFDLNENASWDPMYLNATNGMFGSHGSNPPFSSVEVNPAGSPSSLPLGAGVVWSIPRMYQVSSFRNGQSNNLYEIVFGLTNFPNGGLHANTPTGPIYWADNSSQLITTQGGESTVGSLYNNDNHYWPDLQALKATFPDIMNLQNGANSFYDTSLSTYQGNTSYQGIGEVWNPTLNLTVDYNARGYKYYLGGINSSTLLGPSDGDMKFNIYDRFPFGNTNGPSQFYLHAGSLGSDVTYASSASAYGSLYYFSQGPSGFVNGNGLPGGRYVVTVRATDASGNGSYFEWDLPITLSPWTLSARVPQLKEQPLYGF
jgi:hypothetical protein